MKKTILALMAATLCLSACNFVRYTGEYRSLGNGETVKSSGTYKTENYDSSDFSEVHLSVPAKVVYVPGNHLVEINAPDNFIDHIIVDNKDGVLSISMDRKHSDDEVTITLSSMQLSVLSVKGAADFSAPRGIVSDNNFEASIAGAAEIKIDSLKASKINLNVSGAADFDIRGINCDALDVDVKGAGSGNLAGNVAGNAAVKISGAGDLDVRELNCGNLIPSVKGVGAIREKH